MSKRNNAWIFLILAVVSLTVFGLTHAAAETTAGAKPPMPMPTGKIVPTTTVNAANIIAAEAIDGDTIVVTLDSYFPKFDLNDLSIVVARGQWNNDFEPKFSQLTIKKSKISKDKTGRTVIRFDLAEKLDEDGRLRAENQVLDYSDFSVYFKGDLAKDVTQADNLISWQMPHGGWTKAMEKEYAKPWDGKTLRSKQNENITNPEIGSIDNSATIREIRFLAYVYSQTKDPKYKESILKGLDFLLKMQYPSGGWPQVYPERDVPGGTVYYSNYVTFNDNAMIRVLDLFDQIVAKKLPFNTDVIDSQYYSKLKNASDQGLDYILKSQIKVDGKPTVWCAQHDPVTYEPRPARAYEHVSLSGNESVGIVRYLMGRPDQTEAVKKAIQGALDWFEANKVEGYNYVRKDKEQIYFYPQPGSPLWYRFYEIETGKPIFSGRDGVIKYTIHEIELERREGYSWAGAYAQKLLETAKTIGYYPDKVYVQVEGTNSRNSAGLNLQAGAVREVSPKFTSK